MIRDNAISFVLRKDIEGGYVNDHRDPGGETNFGISKRSHPDEDIKNLTRERAAEIYRDEYWNPVAARVVDLAPRLAFLMFDCSVNQGNGFSAQALQGILHVKQDGIIGPQTLAALQDALDAQKEESIVCQFVAQRVMRYVANRNWSVYGFGWMVRVAKAMIASETHASGTPSPVIPQMLDRMEELIREVRNELA